MVDPRIQLLIMILSGGIFWSCVCRLRLVDKRAYARVRYRYALIGAGSLFAGGGPYIFPFWGGDILGLTIFVATVAAGFWLDKADWEHGAPPSATGPADLSAEKSHEIRY